jgi:hypothetical protein
MDVSVTVNGMEVVLNAMTTLAQLTAVKGGLEDGAQVLRQALVETSYPTANSQKNPYLTTKQRRFLAFAVKAGIIVIPYSRTFGMREAWVRESRNDGLTQVVGNPSAAAQWTHGERRTRYNEMIGWKNQPQLWQQHEQATLEAFHAGIAARV